MHEDTIKALALLRGYTAGSMRLWDIAGRTHAAARAHVMAALRGKDRVPQSEAGVYRLREAFYAAMGIKGECEAAREDNFRSAARNATVPTTA